MAEKGFITADGRYFQVIDGRKVSLADYPAGTVEVPLRPGAGWVWAGDAWRDETPPPPPPDLSPAKFEFMLALSGFDDVWEALQSAAKAQGDMFTYATLKAERARPVFRLDVTIKLVASLADQAAAVAPNVDLNAEVITAAWMQAAEYRGAGA